MTADTNRQWLLRARPDGMAAESDFERRDEPCPAPQDGQVLVRTLYVSVDPAMRGWMTEDPGYAPPIPLGSVMPAAGLGQVVESRRDDFQRGDLVSGLLGWQDFHLSDGGGGFPLAALDPVHPLPAYLGVLGGTGLTAYFGMLDVARPKEGETVVVSAAAGATGSIAAQIGKIQRCRVVGIAGGAAKGRWLTDELGLDGAIDYRSEDVAARLADLCPGGVDVYFDNVGGPTLGAVLGRMNRWGRVALCGMISGYNASAPAAAPAELFLLIARRIRMEGFLLPDYASRFREAQRQLSAWLATGVLRSREEVREGFEQIPGAFLDLFRGANTGKLMVKLSDPPISGG